ncbi:CarD family transcriptional regulator [Desulfotomaculum defluvii]
MFHIGDKVVYPMHGAGIIEAIEEKEILGVKRHYYVMKIRNMQVMFPIDSDLGIRPIVELDVLEDVITNFNHGEPDSSLNPNQRHRSYMNKIRSGDIYQGAQVIRDLIILGKKKTLAAGDKAMLENAQQILLSELALVKGIDQEEATDLLNAVINH